MQNLQTEKVIISLHGVAKIKALLATKKDDAMYIAVNRHKCGAIFYKQENGHCWVDYADGRSEHWQKAAFNDIQDIERRLLVAGFYMVVIAVLEKELQLITAEDQKDLLRLKWIEQQLLARIDTVEMRRIDQGGSSDYWQGQKDAFDIARYMVKSAQDAIHAA